MSAPGTPKASPAAVAAVQEALGAHGSFLVYQRGEKKTFCRCGEGGWMTWAEHSQHQAQAAADAAAPHNAATALREAAKEVATGSGVHESWSRGTVAKLLRDRAARIEASDG